MTENKNIKKGAPARNPVCYQTLQDIVIPAGTILRARPREEGLFGCCIPGGDFTTYPNLASLRADLFKKVIA